MNSVYSKTTVIIMVFGVFAALTAPLPAVSSPANQPPGVLDRQLSSATESDAPLQRQIGSLRGRMCGNDAAGVRIGIEYDEAAPHPRSSLSIPGGDLRTQLDTIARAVGYTWQSHGDWINLLPTARSTEPTWPLNMVIDGEVVVSHDSSIATPIRSWLAKHGISCARDVHGIRVEGATKKLAAAPIVLHDPTLREYINAQEQVYGNDTWTVRVRPVTGGGEVRYWCLVQWSQDSRSFMNAWSPATAPAAPSAPPAPAQ